MTAPRAVAVDAEDVAAAAVVAETATVATSPVTWPGSATSLTNAAVVVVVVVEAAALTEIATSAERLAILPGSAPPQNRRHLVAWTGTGAHWARDV